MHDLSELIPSFAAAFALAACASAPIAPVPDPYPEALPWTSGERAAEGAFLGLEVRENDSGALDDLFFEPGVRVVRVARGSPAARAGMAIGDVLLRFDGRALDDPGALATLLSRAEPGSRARLELRRDDTVFEVALELAAAGGGAAAEVRALYVLDRARSRAGWASGPRGVVLASSAPGGPMERAGLPLGSVVVALDGEELLSERELVRALALRPPGAEVRFTLLGDDGARSERQVRLQPQPRRVTGAALPILLRYDADAEGRRSSFALLDLWLFSLFSYERTGTEKEWRILHFVRFSSGVGELSE